MSFPLEVPCSDPHPPVIVWRPRLISRKKSIFPIQQLQRDEKDQGRSCVSVILKANSERDSQRVKRVEDLSAKYKVRYQCKSSQSRGARLDICFESATKAREFFRRVNDMERRKSISVIMISEERLGKIH